MKAMNPSPKRLTGFALYKDIFSSEWHHFLMIGLIVLLSLLPFAAGVFFAVASSSVLVLIPACILGGMAAGPFLSALYDAVLRCLREAPYCWWRDFKKALRQNLKDSLVPGIILCVFWGAIIFMGMLMWWSSAAPSSGTIALYIFCAVLFTMIQSIFWPQLVLFRQNGFIRLKNSILFCIMYFWRTLLTAIIQVLFFTVMFLFLPWSLIVLPFVNLWVIIFLSCFLLYSRMDAAFQIEKQIKEFFPEQILEYEETEKDIAVERSQKL